MYETLRFDENGDLATITLLRPRINVKQIRELERVCDHLEDVSKAKVLVLRGHSEGIDFVDFDPREAMDIHGFNKWEKLVNRFENLDKVTVALVDGPCVGGGFQLMLVCDQRICVPAASFQLNEVRLGFLPGMATFRLAKYIGLGHAKRIVMTGAVIGADEANRLGLIDQIDTDLDAALARTIQSFGPMHTVAFTMARRLLNESYGTASEDALGNFLAAQHRAISQTAFLDTLRAEHKQK
ncbi:MAG: enoyl-CoA hydratase/isomerase family protein [Myxococcales bacterium]|nr:enoyl-CoA hydratase/isomerase family protein [Myxococcales bacterium]